MPSDSTGLPVLVIGEALVDIVRDGEVEREHPGGSPANIALGLGRLGLPVHFLTRLGPDARGARILAHLRESGVDVLDRSFVDAPTSTATAVIAADGSAEYRFDVQWALPRDYLPQPCALLHVGSIAAFLQPGADVVAAAARSGAVELLSFDPNIRPDLIGTHADALRVFEAIATSATLVKLSDEDAMWLYPGLSLLEVAARVRRLGPPLVAITLGAGGAVLESTDGMARIPPLRVPVVDTIGAGDTFMVSLIDSLLRDRGPMDRPWMDRVGRAAARAAALTVSRAGADLPRRAELETWRGPSTP